MEMQRILLDLLDLYRLMTPSITCLGWCKAVRENRPTQCEHRHACREHYELSQRMIAPGLDDIAIYDNPWRTEP